MPKLTIMQGLPASGKSTKAAEIVKASGNMVRVNKDLLRKMLHFDKWTGNNESVTRAMARMIAKECLRSGINVLIDDTNLNEGTLQGWKDLATEMEMESKVVRMDTSIEECIKRDEARENGVGKHVILGMALKAKLYPKPEKGVVLCDIDGTVANIEQRLHFVKGEKKDWDSFFEHMVSDEPREDVIMSVRNKHILEGRKVFFVSARPEKYRAQTEAWLKEHVGDFYETVFMRPDHDKRDDVEVKADMLRWYFPDYSWIHEVIDDRPRVIRMWQEQGLKVVDVGPGIEF